MKIILFNNIKIGFYSSEPKTIYGDEEGAQTIEAEMMLKIHIVTRENFGYSFTFSLKWTLLM